MELSHFAEIGLIVGIATVLSIVVHFLKQPLIIAYIIAGALIGPTFLNLVESTDLISTFSEIGVVLLLFIVGLNLNPKIIRDVGSVGIFTGGTQVLITTGLGFLIGKLLGFETITSLYLGMAFAFSSTIIVIKFLADKRNLETLYGRISVSHLLVQDILAVFLLLTVSSLTKDVSLATFAGNFLLKLVIGIGVVFLVSHFVFPKILPRIAKSQELLFIFSLGWLFILGGLFQFFNVSVEIGALIAGISFSMLPYHYEIASRMRPLRDFFIILFFIFLGSQMDVANIVPFIIPAIAFSLLVLIGNPVIVLALMGLTGYKRRTSFLTGLTLTQISEFSLILIGLGVSLGHITKDILSFVTLVALMTIAGSTYFNYHAEKIFENIGHSLKFFERKKIREKSLKTGEMEGDVVIFGFNRVGFEMVKALRNMKKTPLVIDYNPAVVKQLQAENIPCAYGDATDVEFLKEIPWKKVSMVLSHISDPETNLVLINVIREQNPKCIIVVVTHLVKNAIRLYQSGATYVLLPHMLSTKQALKMIEKFGFDLECFVQEKIQHLEHLKKFQYEF